MDYLLKFDSGTCSPELCTSLYSITYYGFIEARTRKVVKINKKGIGVPYEAWQKITEVLTIKLGGRYSV